MHITRLEMRDLRSFTHATIRPESGVNLIVGPNGTGKTSVLEALHLMAYGRSFRGRVKDGLIRSSAPALEVFVEWNERSGGTPGRSRRAGLRHSGRDWEARLDGMQVGQLGDLCAALAVVTFEPGSHDLISGGSEVRRRFVDWALFHVEPAFLPLWRRYARALKQRNVLLKARIAGGELDVWDHELAAAGEPLDDLRRSYLQYLGGLFPSVLGELAPALGGAQLVYSPGWRRDEMSLPDALLFNRDRDLQAGHTTAGPHRADWRVQFPALPGREALSRGQCKLTALSALLAQAEGLSAVLGEWPVFGIDDLASELDAGHQARVVRRLLESGAQVLITGTEVPSALVDSRIPYAVFHVEQLAAGMPTP